MGWGQCKKMRFIRASSSISRIERNAYINESALLMFLMILFSCTGQKEPLPLQLCKPLHHGYARHETSFFVAAYLDDMPCTWTRPLIDPKCRQSVCPAVISLPEARA